MHRKMDTEGHGMCLLIIISDFGICNTLSTTTCSSSVKCRDLSKQHRSITPTFPVFWYSYIHECLVLQSSQVRTSTSYQPMDDHKETYSQPINTSIPYLIGLRSSVGVRIQLSIPVRHRKDYSLAKQLYSIETCLSSFRKA